MYGIVARLSFSRPGGQMDKWLRFVGVACLGMTVTYPLARELGYVTKVASVAELREVLMVNALLAIACFLGAIAFKK